MGVPRPTVLHAPARRDRRCRRPGQSGHAAAAQRAGHARARRLRHRVRPAAGWWHAGADADRDHGGRLRADRHAGSPAEHGDVRHLGVDGDPAGRRVCARRRPAPLVAAGRRPGRDRSEQQARRGHPAARRADRRRRAARVPPPAPDAVSVARRPGRPGAVAAQSVVAGDARLAGPRTERRHRRGVRRPGRPARPAAPGPRHVLAADRGGLGVRPRRPAAQARLATGPTDRRDLPDPDGVLPGHGRKGLLPGRCDRAADRRRLCGAGPALEDPGSDDRRGGARAERGVRLAGDAAGPAPADVRRSRSIRRSTQTSWRPSAGRSTSTRCAARWTHCRRRIGPVPSC